MRKWIVKNDGVKWVAVGFVLGVISYGGAYAAAKLTQVFVGG